jgi:hypothetical protein
MLQGLTILLPQIIISRMKENIKLPPDVAVVQTDMTIKSNGEVISGIDVLGKNEENIREAAKILTEKDGYTFEGKPEKIDFSNSGHAFGFSNWAGSRWRPEGTLKKPWFDPKNAANN